MKLEIYNQRRKTTHHAKRNFDRSTWVVWANTQFATVGFLCLFFGFLVTRTGRTSGPIVTIYASYDVILGKDVPFGGYVDMVHYLGGQIPPKPQFWGLNRHFQAKRAKYENLHIIKTTAPISTKFCTLIQTTKYSSWVVQTRVQQIQDGGRPPSWKIAISPQPLDRFRWNFARWCKETLRTLSAVKFFKFSQYKMPATAVLKNR